MTKSAWAAATALAGTLASIAPASAQTQTAPASESAGLQEIIVQARRRAESIQDTPIAVSAIDASTIENRVAQDLTDLQGIAPNVVLDSGGAFAQTSFFSIRGISFQDVESSFDPAVGVTVDGVFIGRNVGSLMDFFDIEQVEILRGPQGTLFGRNTIGGTINVRTARPSGKLGFKGQVTVGNQGRFDVRASAEAPIIQDKLAAKVSFLSQNFDGFWKNTFDNSNAREQDTLAFRGSIRYTPNENWTVDIVGDYMRDRSGSFGIIPEHALIGQRTISPGATILPQFQAVLPAITGALPASIIGLAGTLAGAPGSTLNRWPQFPYTNAYNAENKAPINSGGLVLDIAYEFSGGSLRSITGWRKMDEDIVQDFDSTGLPLFETQRTQTQEQLSQEFKFNTKIGESFDLTAGVYFFTQKYDLTQRFLALFQNPFTGALQPFDLRPLGGGILNNITFQRSKSYAAFMEGTYDFTDQFALTLGGRITKDKKNFRTSLSAIGNAPGTFGQVTCAADPAFPAAPPAARTLCAAEESWTEFTPRGILQFKPNRDLNFYASASRGYKAGGFNGRAASTTSIGPFDPEKVDAFEIGMKSTWLDNRLRFNVTGFWNEYKNLQVEVVQPAPGTASGQETIVRNAAKARTRGLEVELLTRPVEGLTLNATLGYLKANYRNFRDDIIAPIGPGGAPVVIGFEDLTVFKMRRAPKWTWAVGGEYEAPLGDQFSAFFRLDYRHTSEQFTTVRNQPFGRRRPVGILDGSIALGEADGRYRVSLYGKNLTNEQFVNSALAIGDGALFYQGQIGAFTSYGPKREWGAEFSVKF